MQKILMTSLNYIADITIIYCPSYMAGNVLCILYTLFHLVLEADGLNSVNL